MSDIFRKTMLGYEEMASRSHGLTPRLRRCLIMIDGKRTLLELMVLLQGEDISPLVQTLEIDGYIELIGNREQVNSLQRTDQKIASSVQLTTADTRFVSRNSLFLDSQVMYLDRNGQPRKPLSFAERKSRALYAVNELLGPDGEGVALKIEASNDEASLEKSLRTAAIFLHEAVNPLAAVRFKDHVRLMDATPAN